jgi:lipoprotein signal peptidase
MVNKIALILECAGLICLIYGYVKKNRNTMLLAALALWIGGSLGDFVRGFFDGYRGH